MLLKNKSDYDDIAKTQIKKTEYNSWILWTVFNKHTDNYSDKFKGGNRQETEQIFPNWLKICTHLLIK